MRNPLKARSPKHWGRAMALLMLSSLGALIVKDTCHLEVGSVDEVVVCVAFAAWWTWASRGCF